MKKLILLSIVILLAGCKSSKISIDKKIENKMKLDSESQEIISYKYLRLIPNQSISLKKDDTNKIYVVSKEGNKVTVELGYQIRPKDKNIMDGDMEFSLTFELDNPIKSGKWEGKTLGEIKAVYGFHAFHPDSGFYPVTEGSIYVLSKKNKIIIEVNLPEKFGGKYLNGTYETEVK